MCIGPIHSYLSLTLFVLTAVAALCINIPYAHARDMPGIDWSQLNADANPNQANTQNTPPALTFYERCMSSPQRGVTLSDHTATCACMDAHYTIAQARRTAESTPSWQSREREPDPITGSAFIGEVVGPCLHISAPEMILNDCLDDARYRRMFKVDSAFRLYCNCYTDAAMEYYREHAGPYLALRAANGSIGDPIQMVRRSWDYRRFMSGHSRTCLAKYRDMEPPPAARTMIFDGRR